MAEEQMVNATRDDVDEAVFSACEDYAENEPGLSRRERMKLTLTISEAVMFNIDNLGNAAKRSEAAKKAAATRYAAKGDPQKQAKVPTPGPAIPPPAPPHAGLNPQDPNAQLPPPPHPALMPQGVPSAPQPFGAPPA